MADTTILLVITGSWWKRGRSIKAAKERGRGNVGKPRVGNWARGILISSTWCGGNKVMEMENGEKIAGKCARAIKALRAEQFHLTTRARPAFVPDVKNVLWWSRRSFAEAIIARTARHADWNTTIASTTRQFASPAKASAPAKVRIACTFPWKPFPKACNRRPPIPCRVNKPSGCKPFGKLIRMY